MFSGDSLDLGVGFLLVGPSLPRLVIKKGSLEIAATVKISELGQYLNSLHFLWNHVAFRRTSVMELKNERIWSTSWIGIYRYSVNATIFFYHQYHSSIIDHTCYSISLFSSHILHIVFPFRNNLNFILGYNPVLPCSPYLVGRPFFFSIASYLTSWPQIFLYRVHLRLFLIMFIH